MKLNKLELFSLRMTGLILLIFAFSLIVIGAIDIDFYPLEGGILIFIAVMILLFGFIIIGALGELLEKCHQ